MIIEDMNTAHFQTNKMQQLRENHKVILGLKTDTYFFTNSHIFEQYISVKWENIFRNNSIVFIILDVEYFAQNRKIIDNELNNHVIYSRNQQFSKTKKYILSQTSLRPSSKYTKTAIVENKLRCHHVFNFPAFIRYKTKLNNASKDTINKIALATDNAPLKTFLKRLIHLITPLLYMLLLLLSFISTSALPSLIKCHQYNGTSFQSIFKGESTLQPNFEPLTEESFSQLLLFNQYHSTKSGKDISGISHDIVSKIPHNVSQSKHKRNTVVRVDAFEKQDKTSNQPFFHERTSRKYVSSQFWNGDNDRVMNSGRNSIDLKFKNVRSPHEDANGLLRLVLNGLNMKTLPNLAKANISQKEYATMYREYIYRMKRRLLGTKRPNENSVNILDFFSIKTNSTPSSIGRKKRGSLQNNHPEVQSRKMHHHRKSLKTNIHLQFSKQADMQILNSSQRIEEANVRLMIVQSKRLAVQNSSKNNDDCQNQKRNKNKVKEKGNKSNVKNDRNFLILRLFQLLIKNKRKWLDEQTVSIKLFNNNEESFSQWIQFDVTKAVDIWLKDGHKDLHLEVQCDKCLKIGARILTESVSHRINNSHEENLDLMPVLNIITRFEKDDHSHTSRHLFNSNNEDKKLSGADIHTREPSEVSTCTDFNKRCCRHIMPVIFKDIKGFEFILHPKSFDAGYCQGKCPPRYNPANHHAVLQSLIWKQDHHRAPRPCCSPSKLEELEVLHVDEKNSEKLKISTWSDMKVLECACT